MLFVKRNHIVGKMITHGYGSRVETTGDRVAVSSYIRN